MKTITLKIDEETRDELDEEADERGFESRSAYLREIIDRREEREAIREQYEERIDELETDLERVRNEKRLLLEEREEKQELVRYVEDERSAQQRWREAGLATRVKWRLFGMDAEEE